MFSLDGLLFTTGNRLTSDGTWKYIHSLKYQTYGKIYLHIEGVLFLITI